ncbi:MAG: hypothetical protein WCQ53_05350 [bacterium]
MKKFFIGAIFAALATTASLYADTDPNLWKLEPTIGPTMDLHNWGGNQFSMNVKVGKGENWSGLVGLNFGGANAAQIKLGLVYDYPFYLTFSKTNDFAIGPTADAGIKFGAGGGRGSSVDFLNLGFGLRTAYKIKDNFGVVADLVHFTTSFVGWTNGAGVNSGFAMAYDMQFGIFYML